MSNENTGGVTGKGFVKGDPRINRKGRPKSFDALRELAQQIAHETAQSGGVDVVIGDHKVTIAEAILRSWATSKNPQLVKGFIEIAFGKVPDDINVDMTNRNESVNVTVYIPENNRDNEQPATS